MNQSLSMEIAAVMPAAIATGLPVSTITIQQPSGNYDTAGAPDGLYVDVSGLVALKCMIAPFNTGERIQVEELKTISEVGQMALTHIWMTGYFPQVKAHWRAIVDGVAHDIVGVEWDSQSQMTRLKAQVLNV